MKKITVLLLALVIGGMVSCSKSPADKDAELKALTNEVLKATQSTAEKLQKAADGKEAGDIVLAYGDTMKKIKEKYKNFDLNDTKNFEGNEELKKIMGDFVSAVMNVNIKFKDSKELAEAMQNVNK